MYLSVSVIIPVHNGAPYIREAIESVMSQALPAAEIIVVDDGSTDETSGILSAMENVRYVRQEKSGQAIARNRGFAESTGDLIAFLDADDVWMPEKLALQVAALDSDPPFDCVFGLAVEFAGSRPPAREIELSESMMRICRGRCWCGGTCLLPSDRTTRSGVSVKSSTGTRAPSISASG